MELPTKAGKVFRKIKRIFKWVLLLVALYLAYVVGFVYFTQAIPMKPSQLTRAPGGICVFTGTRARLVEGFQMLRKYPKSHLLISGVNEGMRVSFLIKKSGVPCCVPEDQITLDHAAQDTIENAIQTAHWARARGMKHVCLITSNYHMPRSLLEMHYYAPDIEVIPHPVMAAAFLDNTWWDDPDLLRAAWGEYNKYLLAWLRQKFEPYFA